MKPGGRQSRGVRRRGEPDEAPGRSYSPTALWMCVATVLVALILAGAVRWRYADTPLERDEGEYAYAGQLILQGEPPYSLAYNMKFPGTYYAYAGIMAVFGESPRGIHRGFLLVNGLAAVLVGIVAFRWLGPFGAAISAVTFLLLSLDRGVLGTSAHATQFVVVPVLLSIIVLQRSSGGGAALLAGSLAGMAVMMKQQALPFVLFVVAYAMWAARQRQGGQAVRFSGPLRTGAITCAGAMLPLAVTGAVLASQGVFDRFWFWTFQYASSYASTVPASEAWGAFARAWTSLTAGTGIFWWGGVLGVAAVWTGSWAREVRVGLTLWFVAAVLAVCPGFFFREHYFVVLIPPVAVGLGTVAATVVRMFPSVRVSTTLVAALLLIQVGSWASGSWDYLTRWSPRELSRALYGANPFVESPEISRYVAERTQPSDRVAVLGSEPQIYFYANRRSATGYIYTYGLMEPQPYAARMQLEMIREIEAAEPKVIVLVLIGTSWLPRPESDPTILNWTNRYLQACYRRVGVAEIHSATSTSILWGADADAYTPQSDRVITTYERLTDRPCPSALPG